MFNTTQDCGRSLGLIGLTPGACPPLADGLYLSFGDAGERGRRLSWRRRPRAFHGPSTATTAATAGTVRRAERRLHARTRARQGRADGYSPRPYRRRQPRHDHASAAARMAIGSRDLRPRRGCPIIG